MTEKALWTIEDAPDWVQAALYDEVDGLEDLFHEELESYIHSLMEGDSHFSDFEEGFLEAATEAVLEWIHEGEPE